MKTPILNMMAGLMVLGSLTTSCNSCTNKDTDKPTDPGSPQVNTDGSSADYRDNASGENEINTEGSAGTTSKSGTVGSASNGTSGGQSGSATATDTRGKTKKGSKNGYSAPDGTDAENHDGDQYTRNDTMRMPSGPPIQ